MRDLLLNSLKHLTLGYSALICFAFTTSAIAEQWTIVALENPPYSYKKDGIACGSGVLRVQTAIEALGKKAHISIVPWKRALTMIRSGEAQVAFNASHTTEREKYAYYTQTPLIEEIYIVYKRSEDRFPDALNHSNIKDFRIGIQRGYNYPKHWILSEAHTEILDTIPQALQMLTVGRIDLFIGDQNPVNYWLNKAGLNTTITPFMEANTAKPIELGRLPTYLIASKQSVTPAELSNLNNALKDQANSIPSNASLASSMDQSIINYCIPR